MRGFRWISNLASAECTLSHCLPDTMGSPVDYDEIEDGEALEQRVRSLEGQSVSAESDSDKPH